MQTNSASRAYICITAFDCHAEATKMHKQMVYERQSINLMLDSLNYLGSSQNMKLFDCLPVLKLHPLKFEDRYLHNRCS